MTAPAFIASHRITAAFLGVALALGAVLLWTAGPAPQLLFPSDDAAYLDASHRASLGQWLGRDFRSPIGPAALLPTVVAMKWRGATVQAFVLASVLTWSAYGILAWFAARSRMHAGLAAAFSLFVAATAAAPYTLDFGRWNILSYGMLYNRLAWAALGLAAVAALLPRLDRAATPWLSSGLGACATWLWAIKPNYLLILAPLILWHWLPRDGRRGDRFVRGLLGALGTLLLLWLAVPFSPAGYVSTHLGMAREAPPELLGYTLDRSLRENAWLVLGLGVLWGLVLKTSVATSGRWRLAGLVGAIIATTFVTNVTNCQFSEIPFWGALGWIAAARAAGAAPASRLARAAVLGGVAYGLAFTWQPVTSIAYNFAWKNYRSGASPSALEVASPAWKGMPMRAMPGEPSGPAAALEIPGNYAAWLNDGLQLLARVRPAGGTVLCLDWTNPFPFATQSEPVRGDEIAWHFGRTVGPSYHPDIAQLLASVSVVMEPVRSIQPDSLAFKHTLFGPTLTASFQLAGETGHWRAWVRRPLPAPAP